MPTLASGGGPAINTGNAAWDQGLGSLGGALFPDPTRVAQAGYYGAEQRNKQLQSSKLRDQMAHQQGLDAAASTLTMPQTSYAPSPEGPNMPPIMQPPGSYVPSQAPPAAAPPTLSATVAGAPPPAAAPAPPAAPAAGTVGANMAPGGLSGLFAGGGGAVPDGGGTVRLDQGTPPPVSSPAQGAGAPPAPNNTASDGSVPTNDAVSGVFHPGSITPPGGGTKTTGPANADGSPAKPMITAAQYVAMAVGAGHDANQAMLEWRSMISSMYDTGRIDENTYHHMMGAAEPSIINQDTSSRTAITTTGMTNQASRDVANIGASSAATVERMRNEEADRARGDALVDSVDDQGNKVLVPRRDLKPGQKGYDATLANTRLSAAVAPVQTQPVPGGPVVSSTAEDAQKNKTRLYTPGTADINQTQRGAIGTYVKPDDPDPTHVRTMTAGDAADQGWIPYGTMAPKAPMTANESFQQGAQAHSLDQEIYPQAQKGSLTSPGYVSAPVVFSPKMQAQIQALTARFMRDPATRGDPGAAHRMAVQALQQSGDLPSATQVEALRNAGGIISTAGGRVTDPRLTVSPNYDGKGTTTPHLWVGGKDEKNPNDPGAPTAFNPEPGPRAGSNVTPQPQPGPQAPPGPQPGPQVPPTVAAPGAPGSVTALFGPQRLPNPAYAPPAAPNPGVQTAPGRPTAGKSAPAPRTAVQATPPSGAVAEAPGKPDGTRMLVPGTNQPGVVRGGFLFPLPSVTAGGGG
jgi:hypothetical protein